MIVDPDFISHWKTKALTSALGDSGAALTAILSLWAHCQTRRAWQFQLTALRLAGICGYTGRPEKLWEAMVELPLISPVDGELGWWEVHQWAEKNAELVRRWGGNCGGWNAKGGPNKRPKATPSKDPVSEPAKRPSLKTPSPDPTDRIGLDKIGEEKSTKPEAPASPGRARDLCFEKLASLQGSDVGMLTKSERGRLNSALKDLRSIHPDLTPAMLDEAAEHYRALMGPDVQLTCTGLAANWSRCADLGEKKEGGPPGAGEVRAADFPWRAVAARILEWMRVPVSDEAWFGLEKGVRHSLRIAWDGLTSDQQQALREVAL